MATVQGDRAAVSSPGQVGTPDQVHVLKALADPVRLRLLGLIAAAPPGGICVCDVVAEFDLSQPTISHHLRLLREAGLVDSYRRSTWVYYSLRFGALDPLWALLETLGTAPQSRGAANMRPAG